MLLRASISNTKKFFKKTICNVKSFFSNSYHRLPKAPPPFAAVADMEKDSTFHFVSSQTEAQSGGFMKNNSNAVHFSKKMDETQMARVEKSHRSMNIRATHQRKTAENCESSSKLQSNTTAPEYDQRRMCLVAKKIKELEKLDARNVDHALDIEEVLHYYSRLTCPAYLEIVDKFFMDIFAEFSEAFGTIKPRLIRPESVGLLKRRSRLENSSSDFF